MEAEQRDSSAAGLCVRHDADYDSTAIHFTMRGKADFQNM